MKALNAFLILILLTINIIYCLGIKSKENTNSDFISDIELSLLELSKENLNDQLFSLEKDLNLSIEKLNNFDKNIENNSENDLFYLFQDEISSLIKYFHINNAENKQEFKKKYEKKSNGPNNNINKRVFESVPSLKNSDQKDNFLFNNKIKDLIKKNDNPNKNKLIKKLGKNILRKIICKNKKRILLNMLQNKILEMNMTENFTTIFKKTKNIPITPILEMIFKNKTIEEKHKIQLRKEIGILMEKSKDPQIFFNYTKENMNEIKSIINETLFCQNFCSYNGYCFNGKCFCQPGFKGADCSFRLKTIECPNQCSGQNGVCNQDGICICNKGFSGNDCSLKRKI